MRRGLVSLLILCFAGCGIVEPKGLALQFDGTVTAQATGQPLAGALIALADPTILWGVRKSVTTDSQGHYSLGYTLNPCVDGEAGATLTASESGFASNTVQITCTGGEQRFDFSLEPAQTP